MRVGNTFEEANGKTKAGSPCWDISGKGPRHPSPEMRTPQTSCLLAEPSSSARGYCASFSLVLLNGEEPRMMFGRRKAVKTWPRGSRCPRDGPAVTLPLHSPHDP